MKKVQILSGNFATGEGRQGNFSAYDDDRERYFVPKNLMLAHGWKEDKDVKFPFWAKVKVAKIGQLDENGEPLVVDGVPVLVDRPEVRSIFKTDQELIDSEISKATIDIKIQAGIQSAATTAGLSKESIAHLVDAVV